MINFTQFLAKSLKFFCTIVSSFLHEFIILCIDYFVIDIYLNFELFPDTN